MGWGVDCGSTIKLKRFDVDLKNVVVSLVNNEDLGFQLSHMMTVQVKYIHLPLPHVS